MDWNDYMKPYHDLLLSTSKYYECLNSKDDTLYLSLLNAIFADHKIENISIESLLLDLDKYDPGSTFEINHNGKTFLGSNYLINKVREDLKLIQSVISSKS